MADQTVLTREDRIALARDYHAKQAIIQKSWHKQASDGRHLVCALAAFGKPGEINGTDDCPADLMPSWLASLVPAIDDGIAENEVAWFSGELIDRAAQWHRLDDAAWERIRTRFMIAGVRAAVDAATKVHQDKVPEYWPQVTSACDQVCTALETGKGLEEAEAAAWAAEAAARAAARAAEAAAWAAEAAAWAAEAAARAAARAAEAAAWAAARAAAWAAARAAARAAEAAAWAAARAAAWAAARAAARAAAWAAARAAAWAAAWKELAQLLFDLIDGELSALSQGADHA